MINIYYQFIHSLKCIFLDTKSLISKLLTFSLVILVLGSAFGDAFGNQVEPVQVGILNQDSKDGKDTYSKDLIVNMLEPKGELDPDSEEEKEEEEKETVSDSEDVSVSQWMKVYHVKSEEDGQRLAGDSDIPEGNRISAMIRIDEKFSEDFEKNMTGSKKIPIPITIKTGRTSQVDSTVVKCVFDTFSNTLNASTAVMKHFPGQSLPEDLDLEKGYEEVETDAKSTPDAMSYYSIAMLMMVLLYGAEYGCNSIADDYLGVIGERIKTTPIKRYEQYIGKMLGMCTATTLQGIFIVLLTGLVYGAKWGSNYFALLGIIFSMACASVTLGACLCMITRNGPRGQAMVSLLVIACTFLAGGFIKMDMGVLKYISPNYYAQTAMFNSIYNGDTQIALQHIGILWIFVIAAGAFTILLSRRKRA